MVEYGIVCIEFLFIEVCNKDDERIEVAVRVERRRTFVMGPMTREKLCVKAVVCTVCTVYGSSVR